MPRVDMSFEHGQTFEVAQANFEKGIGEARAKFRIFIRHVEWADDRKSARLSGNGFDIRLRLDENQVHVDGDVAIFPRFLEGPVRRFLAQTFRGGSDEARGPSPHS